MLLERVWNYHFDPQTNIVETHISRLRSKLNEGGNADLIERFEASAIGWAATRSWRSSAAYQIAFINFGAYSAGLALLGVIVFAVMHIAFSRQLDLMVFDEFLRCFRSEYAGGGNGELAEAIAEREAQHSSTRMLYAVFAPDGRRIQGSLDTPRPPIGRHPIIFQDPVEGPDEARAVTVDLSPTERLVVAIDSEWLEGIERVVIIIFAAAFLGACIVGFGGAVILVPTCSVVCRRSAVQQRRSSAVTFVAECRSVRGGTSSRRSAATLNRMLDRIEGLLENLRQVSATSLMIFERRSLDCVTGLNGACSTNLAPMHSSRMRSGSLTRFYCYSQQSFASRRWKAAKPSASSFQLILPKCSRRWLRAMRLPSKTGGARSSGQSSLV